MRLAARRLVSASPSARRLQGCERAELARLVAWPAQAAWPHWPQQPVAAQQPLRACARSGTKYFQARKHPAVTHPRCHFSVSLGNSPPSTVTECPYARQSLIWQALVKWVNGSTLSSYATHVRHFIAVSLLEFCFKLKLRAK